MTFKNCISHLYTSKQRLSNINTTYTNRYRLYSYYTKLLDNKFYPSSPSQRHPRWITKNYPQSDLNIVLIPAETPSETSSSSPATELFFTFNNFYFKRTTMLTVQSFPTNCHLLTIKHQLNFSSAPWTFGLAESMN